MFVRKSKYEDVCKELAKIRAELKHMTLLWKAADLLFHECVRENLRLRANLFAEQRKPSPPEQFTQEEIKDLLMLCHPDKHNGSARATKLTTKILALRARK